MDELLSASEIRRVSPPAGRQMSSGHELLRSRLGPMNYEWYIYIELVRWVYEPTYQ